MKFVRFSVLYFLLSITCYGCIQGSTLKLIHKSYFTTEEANQWIAEIEQGDLSFNERYMELDVSKGATLWFAQKLYAPVEIEFTVVVVDSGGANDRVSDMNCFWMATDPRCTQDEIVCANVERTGAFGDYHNLKTYYMGFGGHDNSKTRFRRYTGDGVRPLLEGHEWGSPFLIKPNAPQKINISVYEKGTKYSVNDEILLDFKDPEALTEGWFAFRTVQNRLRVLDFKLLKSIN